MLTKDEAICIRALDYSETSQVITFFTRANGKIGAIAKGSKRPKSAFDGPMEVFSYGKVVFSDSNREKLATLTEFEQQPAFTSLSTNLFAFNCCLFAAELLDKMAEDYDPHPELFDSFFRLLQESDEIQNALHASRDTLALLVLFQLSLLKEVGLQPILSACANCKNDFHSGWAQIYFSNSINGLICRDCEASFADKIRLTKNAANALNNLKLIGDANEETLNEIEKILISHFTELLHHPPKMAKYILKG
ncbi:MAG: DNA repair protein RecO [Planctomycetota bacterium]|jgi:DNA repair protein RecO (recombination protein O)